MKTKLIILELDYVENKLSLDSSVDAAKAEVRSEIQGLVGLLGTGNSFTLHNSVNFKDVVGLPVEQRSHSLYITLSTLKLWSIIDKGHTLPQSE